ncbi:MAG: ABC transporter permease [Caldilineaceae bacterium]|nr:ABC transporter permease [Caldilineaceae bacterium]
MRELKTRYKGSILGFFWGLLSPLAMMLVFTFVFTVMMPNTQVENFPIFVLTGLLPWNFFTSGVMGGISSVVANGNLVKKVYFPREVLPTASVLSSMINFLLALVVLALALLVFGAKISPWIWLLPLIILVQTVLILGIVLFLCTVNVFYRDTLMIVDVVMLASFFLTPVFYPIDILPKNYDLWGVTLDIHRWVRILNPMASLITAYRDLFYYGYRTEIYFLLRTIATSIVFLGLGYWFFLRFSGRFGEEV